MMAMLKRKYNLPVVLCGLLYSVLASVAIVCISMLVMAPQEEMPLLPIDGQALHLYADSIEPGGQSEARWINRDRAHFQCEFAKGIEYPYCGIVIKFKQPGANDSNDPEVRDEYDFETALSYDLSEYENLYIDMNYGGAVSTLNFFVRNASTMPTTFEEYERTSYLNTDFNPNAETIHIKLSDFRVASWWADRYLQSSDERDATLTHVLEMGIDFPSKPPLGVYDIELVRIAVTKPMFPESLVRLALYCALGVLIFCLTTQAIYTYYRRLKAEAIKLRETANIDPLTQCVNRLGLETVIDQIFPANPNAKISVIVFDLDHFKRVNDTYGHSVGDQVLLQTASVVSEILRKEDVFGRWGGEEFVVITRVEASEIESLLKRLMTAVSSVIYDGGHETFSVTMSIGVTEARDNETFTEIFNRADEAMYQAKLAGRATWRIV